ncbi:MAG: tetratricopeptide repeat protein [Bacteroidales bacterium]|nr:tetratricopeptide repeat protein [Bacteroidales bacterium]
MKKLAFFIFTLYCTVSLSTLAVSTDSLMQIIKKHRYDTLSLSAYLKLLPSLESNPELYEKTAKDALTLSQFQKNESFIARFSILLAEKNEQWGEFSNAKNYYQQALDVYLKWDSLRLIANLKNNLGRISEKMSNYEKAITYYLESMKLREKLKDKKGIASSLNSLGLMYYHTENYPMALKYFYQSLSLVQEMNSEIGMATVNNNLGMLYFKKAMYDSALYFYNQSLQLLEKKSNQQGISSVYLNIANVLSKKQDSINAEKYYLKALKLKEKLNDKAGLISIYNSLAVLYQNRKQYQKAISFAIKANNIANELVNSEGQIQSNKILSEIYDNLGNYKDAYFHYTWYIRFRDSIYKIENTRYINQLQEQYQAEKREQQIQLANSKLKENELKIKQQTTYLYGAIIVIILTISLVVVVLRSNRQRKRANELLAAQNEEITKQKNIIEEKNKDILSSITYAQRIQKAILPSKALLDNYLSDSFVLYKPKDIVSGDFYWFKALDKMILFAVVDCTGHGVPGAFMSIVGYNGLNQVVNDFTKNNPGLILDLLNDTVKNALHTAEKEIRDGMDIALCSYDKENKILRFAGANNPLYLVRKKSMGLLENNDNYIEYNDLILYEIKATPQPIGEFVKQMDFVMHEITLKEHDTIYIFSDGYADQFGGQQGKKLKYKAFKQILLNNYTKPLSEQEKELDLFFEQWKNGYEQIDDVCVMGVRF